MKKRKEENERERKKVVHVLFADIHEGKSASQPMNATKTDSL